MGQPRYQGSENDSYALAESTQEVELLEQFLSSVALHENFQVFAYGGYERAFLTRTRGRSHDPATVDKVLDRLINALSHVYSHFYFPTYSNGLKDIGAYLGCSWTDPEASGIQSLAWRMRWDAAHDDESKQRLMRYNLEDCAALKRVAEFLRASVCNNVAGVEPLKLEENATPVSFVPELTKAAYEWSFGPIDFVHPDFEHINRCAYFDYQRDRVYVRTSPTLRRIKARRIRPIVRSRRLRLNARVKIEPSHCPRCESEDIAVAPLGTKIDCVRPRRKRAFDLEYTSTGIRRRVIEVRSSAYRADFEIVGF